MDNTEKQEKYFEYNGIKFITNMTSVEHLDWVKDYKAHQDDVFIVSYPKSGTTWMQQIVSLVLADGDVDSVKNESLYQRAPWIDFQLFRQQSNSRTKPVLITSHLNYQMIPTALKKKMGKVIYIARNPKDVIVSSYHFHSYFQRLKVPKDFQEFLELFVEGDVFYGSWFDHIRDWYSNKEEISMLFVTYEEIHRDIRAGIEKIRKFLGKELDGKIIDTIIKYSKFENMRADPATNFLSLSKDLLDHDRGKFQRKGIVGDWKYNFLVAQNEWFDSIYQERMADFPVKFY
uniref:Sulfotransferase n=1 Tax=Callorhinchus milii TaxID=7868 RepID=K4GLB7_CALMI|nr:amine sulfotransferase [Callorhinchus milii]